MRAAVVGGGLAGLAAVWHLLQKNIAVTLFDRGGGASLVSTGLLHPFPGREALRSWRAEEGMEATRQLLQVAETALGRPVAEQTGVLRFAVTEQQKATFPDRSPVAGTVGTPALRIPEGITVYPRLYLEGLEKACHQAQRICQSVTLEELDAFDAVILTAGAATLEFAVCRHLPLQCTLGQSLICRWKERLPISLLGQGHITPTEDPELCQVGSTYEHTPEPDPKKALELIEKVALFYPPARQFEVVEIRSGVRIAPKIGYRPLLEKVAPKTWVFTGFGSRGLLYHALLARELVSEITDN